MGICCIIIIDYRPKVQLVRCSYLNSLSFYQNSRDTNHITLVAAFSPLRVVHSFIIICHSHVVSTEMTVWQVLQTLHGLAVPAQVLKILLLLITGINLIGLLSLPFGWLLLPVSCQIHQRHRQSQRGPVHFLKVWKMFVFLKSTLRCSIKGLVVFLKVSLICYAVFYFWKFYLFCA